MKFRKKPVVIEAEEFHGMSHETVPEGVNFLRPDQVTPDKCLCGFRSEEHGYIHTLEGDHLVCVGDWVITGVKGERYPCKPDIFEMTYERLQPNPMTDPV